MEAVSFVTSKNLTEIIYIKSLFTISSVKLLFVNSFYTELADYIITVVLFLSQLIIQRIYIILRSSANIAYICEKYFASLYTRLDVT